MHGVPAHALAAMKTSSRIDGSSRPLIVVVDDDDSMRSAIRRALFSAGFAVQEYASGMAVLAEAGSLGGASCLVLDVNMPGMSGLELQARLQQTAGLPPVLFLSGSADIPIAVTAMRQGAVDFVEKPFNNADLVARVQRAIDKGVLRSSQTSQQQEAARRLAALTPRQKAVLDLVVTGMTSKEVARQLGCSHRTIDIHRQSIMEKLQAQSLADLVRLSISTAAAASGDTGNA
jgi:FixJ family two-component response regulator